MMNIIFAAVILQAECQKPIIDSTRSLYNSRNIADFDIKFSVWFSLMIQGSIITEIFSITQFSSLELRLSFNKNLLIIEQSDQLIQLDIKEIYSVGIWFHLEVSRDDDYYIQFHKPFIKKYNFQQNVSYAIIKSNFEINKACMIYKSVSKEIFPIREEIQIDQLMETQIQQETFYFQYTSVQIYLRKKFNEGDQFILSFYANQQCKFFINQFNNTIFSSNFQFDITQEQIERWFCIILIFDIKSIEVRIKFFNSEFFKILPNDLTEYLFYIVQINKNCYYQYLKLIYNFNLSQEIQFQVNSKDIQACGINMYLDLDNNICRQYIDDSRITTRQQTQTQDNLIDQFNRGVLFEQDYNNFYQQSIDILEIQRLLEQFANGINIIIKYSPLLQTTHVMNKQYNKGNKDPFISKQTDNYILCQQYYFGGRCQNKIKNCKNVNNKNYCISCDYSYFLNKRKCQKCPQNCLICQYSNKQLRCLIPLYHYYVNQIGVSRYCECQYCYQGKCNNDQLYINSIIQVTCIIKACPDNLYYDINKQTCFEIPEKTQIYLNYYSRFLQSYNYDLKQTQYQICQLQDPIISLKQLNKFYLTQQLINTYQENLKQSQIQQYNYYLMNKYNLNCTEYTFDPQGDAVCGLFRQQRQKQEKCPNPPCEFYLKLENITIFLDINTTYYKQITYDTLNSLIHSISDVGIQYKQVELDILISWAFADTETRKISSTILILEDNLPLHLGYAKFILNIRFSNLLLLNYPILNVNIYFFDEIQIKDQNINFDFEMEIQSRILIVKNLTIYNKMSKILLNQCYFIKFQDIIIFGVPYFLIQNVNQVQISDIYIESLEILQNIFQLSNIEVIHFSQVQFIINIAQYSDILYFQKICLIYLNNLQLTFDQTIDTNIIQIYRSNFTYISKITIRDNQANNSQIFLIQDCTDLEFIDIVIIAEKSNHLHAFQIQGKSCLIKFIIIQFFQDYHSKLLSFHGNTLKLEDTTFKISQRLNHQLILISSQILYLAYLKLENFIKHISKSQIIDVHYLISLQIFEECLLYNIQLQNLSLFGFGLLQITGHKVSLSSIYIYNIYVQTNIDLNFIQLTGLSQRSQYKFTNSLISKINLIPDKDIDLNLFNIMGDILYIEDINLKQVYSIISIKKFLFQVIANQTYVSGINVGYCERIDIIQIESNQFHLNQLNYYKSSASTLFMIQNNKALKIYMQNLNLQTIQGSILFVNSSINLNIKFLNIQVNGIQKSQLFIIHGQFVKSSFQQIIIFNSQALLDQEYLFEFYDGIESKLNQIYINQINCQFLKTIILKRVIFENILIKNVILIKRQYLVDIVQAQIYLHSIQFKNIKTSQGLISLFQRDENVFIQHLVIINCADIKSVILIHQGQQIDKSHILIQNIYGINTDFEYFFQLYSSSKILNIFDLFMKESTGQLAIGNLSTLAIHNSIVIDCADLDYNIKANNSQFIGDNLEYYLVLELINSLVFNSLKQSIYQHQGLIMSLSFGFKKDFLQVKTIDKNQFEIKEINNQKYFYVPSGSFAQDYKRLDLKKLQYKQIYNGFYLLIKGKIYFNISNFICNQEQYYNNSLVILNQTNYLEKFTAFEGINNIDQKFIINPHNPNYTEYRIECVSNIANQTISLKYYVKSFPCQLGEYLQMDQCLQCNISQNQYSVTYNATKCQYINNVKIKAAKPGLIELQLNYWRYKYNSQIIEFCDSEYCRGGWIPGDQSCVKSRIGAVCKECDLYNIRGDGHYTNNNGECIKCQQLNLRFISQFLFAIIFQLFLVLTAYYSNNNISKQYLMYRVGFRQFYQILYRQSVDQPSIIIKMYSNYLFMLYIIRQNFDFVGELFVVNINFMNNPNLIFQAQLQCFLYQIQNLDIIYSYYYFYIINLFFILTLVYTIYLILVFLKRIQLSIGLIIFITEGIFLYNLKIIFDIATNLLFSIEIAGEYFVRLNQYYLYYSTNHIRIIKNYILPYTITFLMVPILYLVLSNQLVLFNRKARKIFTLFFQQFKPQVFYWDYIIIYTRYAMMVLLIQQKNSNSLILLIVHFLLIVNYLVQPYYFQTLNKLDFILFLTFAVELNLTDFIQRQQIWIYIPIMLANLMIAYFFTVIGYKKACILNRQPITDFKLTLLKKIPWVNSFIAVNKEIRNQNNIMALRCHVKQTYLRKRGNNQALKQYEKSSLNEARNLQVEIELGQVESPNHEQL